MLQQDGGLHGNVSLPQEFVRLVGCRQLQPGPGREARARLTPIKG
jgi:hypothetical protein